MTTVGVIVDLGAADEAYDTLIPWHRVWEVYSRAEGELRGAFIEGMPDGTVPPSSQ